MSFLSGALRRILFFSLAVISSLLIYLTFRSSSTNTILITEFPTSKLSDPLTFQQWIQQIPWDEVSSAVQENNEMKIKNLTTLFVDQLSHFVIMEPMAAINQSCHPPAPIVAEEIYCGDEGGKASYYPGFHGSKRHTPAKIAHIVQLGFDIDMLEVHLWELHDIVDYFFIIESTKTHSGVPKPLIWERVKNQPRFRLFQAKIVHLVLDDPDLIGVRGSWAVEILQEQQRLQKFLRWNNRTNHFKENDVVGLGDTDEVPSRRNVQILKYCTFEKSVDMGIWFPYGQLDRAFEADWTVRNHPYALGDPTFWNYSYLQERASIPGGRITLTGREPDALPSRRRGTSPQYLLGGAHLSNHPYLPFLLVKRLTMSEVPPVETLRKWVNLKPIIQGNLREFEMTIQKIAIAPPEAPHRVKKISDIDPVLLEGIVYTPWFLACNLARYPEWTDLGHDPRVS